jgi:metal-responsive CopG/Arc/MetJ family transcriptional regulator
MGVISISIPDDLLEAFDNFLEENQFSSRSDGIRSAIQAFISLTEEYTNLQGEHVFSGVYVLEDQAEVWEKFEAFLDEFHLLVKNVHSYKLSDHRIYSVLSIGYVGDILKMHNQLSGVKTIRVASLRNIF